MDLQTMPDPSITNLEKIVDSLPAGEREIFKRIYSVSTAVGELRPLPTMEANLIQQFGSLEAVTRQNVIRVTNLITLEGMLYNELRRFRPADTTSNEDTDARLAQAREKDVFRSPLESTPEDTFGRIKGKYCITAGNLFKSDAVHGVIIFNEFNPLHFTREHIIDYIDTGWKWAQQARQTNPEAKYFFFLWNCLWRAGATLVHGHAQVLLASGMHYAKVESLRRAALSYHQQYKSNYFSDLFYAHRSVGCGLEKNGVKILSHLTPFRYNEAVIIAEQLSLPFKELVYEVLACMRDKLGVNSFNLSLVTPPLAPTGESWEGFPVIARVVDRGDISTTYSDVGSAEIYASGVVFSDPFTLAQALSKHLK